MGIGPVAVVATVWFMLPTEEKRILGRLESLAEAVSFESEESPIEREALGARIAAYFTERARINLGAPFTAIEGRDALTGLLTALRVPDGGVNVTFVEITINFDRRLLIASGRVIARVTLRASPVESIYGERPLDVALRQIEGDWLVDDLHAVDDAGWEIQ